MSTSGIPPFEDGASARNAHAERVRIKKQQEAQQLAKLIAASLQQPTSNNTASTVTVEEFNKLKAQVEPVLSYHDEKVKDQLEVATDFVKDRLVKNAGERVLCHDMNFELTEFSRERGTTINSREVKGLLCGKLKIPYESKNGNYYYMGVKLK